MVAVWHVRMPRLFPLVVLLSVMGCSEGRDDTLGLPDPQSSTSARDNQTGAVQEPQPVAPNRDVPVPDGFRGDVHPLLSGHNRLDVAARWSPIRPGRALRVGYFPPVFYEPFTALRTASAQRTYGDRDFSAFLPAQVESVGQMWSVDAERAVEFLRQWCPAASTKLIAPGRRAGPDGMFAILRAVAPTHWDVVLRMHAEFHLEPGVFLTPSCFLGRMIVNRQTGSIDYFSLSIPHDKGLNATLTVRLETEALIDIVNIEQMELVGGDAEIAARVSWEESLDLDVAHERLKQAFFKFLDIDWVPPERALAKAQELAKPVMAVVLWGCLDEQSC